MSYDTQPNQHYGYRRYPKRLLDPITHVVTIKKDTSKSNKSNRWFVNDIESGTTKLVPTTALIVFWSNAEKLLVFERKLHNLLQNTNISVSKLDTVHLETAEGLLNAATSAQKDYRSWDIFIRNGYTTVESAEVFTAVCTRAGLSTDYTELDPYAFIDSDDDSLYISSILAVALARKLVATDPEIAIAYAEDIENSAHYLECRSNSIYRELYSVLDAKCKLARKWAGVEIVPKVKSIKDEVRDLTELVRSLRVEIEQLSKKLDLVKLA